MHTVLLKSSLISIVISLSIFGSNLSTNAQILFNDKTEKNINDSNLSTEATELKDYMIPVYVDIKATDEYNDLETSQINVTNKQPRDNSDSNYERKIIRFSESFKPIPTIAAEEDNDLITVRNKDRQPVYATVKPSQPDRIMYGDFKPSTHLREAYTAEPTSLVINTSYANPPKDKNPSKHDHSSINKRMTEFQYDIGYLKHKYPELMDLSKDFPILEEIMIQKVEEKLMKNQHDENLGKLNHQFPKSYPKHSGKYTHVHSRHPYTFHSSSFPTSYDAIDHYATPTTSSIGSYVKPEDGYYGEYTPYPHTPYGKEHDYPFFGLVSHKKHSLLKKALSLLTTFLPLGLLLTALSPSIVTINSTDNPNPLKQRSTDKSQGMTTSSDIPDIILEAINRSSGVNPKDISESCRDRIICEFSVFANSPTVERTADNVYKFFKNISKLLMDYKPGNIVQTAIRNRACYALACNNEKVITSLLALKIN